MEIRGKNIVVTGGLGNLGNAICDFLKKSGANVIVFDRLDSNSENVYKVDLTDEIQIEEILGKIDRIDVLINCAGEIYSEPIVNMMKATTHSIDSWRRVISNNLDTSFIMGSRVATKMIKDRTKGVIVNFSSVSAEGNMGQVAYSSAKAGVEAMTKVFAKELGMFKIRVCAIAPGFINTESTKESLSDSMLKHWEKETPLRKLGTTEDITKTIQYILETDYLTGAIIHIDGGLVV